MSIKTILIPLMVVYLIVEILNSLSVSKPAANVTAPLIVMGFFFFCYAVLGITLTVKLNNAGAFNWIAASLTIKILC